MQAKRQAKWRKKKQKAEWQKHRSKFIFVWTIAMCIAIIEMFRIRLNYGIQTASNLTQSEYLRNFCCFLCGCFHIFSFFCHGFLFIGLFCCPSWKCDFWSANVGLRRCVIHYFVGCYIDVGTFFYVNIASFHRYMCLHIDHNLLCRLHAFVYRLVSYLWPWWINY